MRSQHVARLALIVGLGTWRLARWLAPFAGRLLIVACTYGAIGFGLWQIYEPAAWIVVGGLLWLDLYANSRERPQS